jgi:hypothetical protein
MKFVPGLTTKECINEKTAECLYCKCRAVRRSRLIGVSPAWATGELHIFNWGDYTNPDLIKKFEDKYGVKVTLDGYDSLKMMFDPPRNCRAGSTCSMT